MDNGIIDGPPQHTQSSRGQVARAAVIALLVAGVLLVTAVLPAEYGLDPLGTGRLLGLTQLSGTAPIPDETIPVTGSDALKPRQEGPIGRHTGEFKVDSRELTLGPYEYIEYKYRLEEGASLQYSWTSNVALAHDFHGGPEGTPATSEQSFDKQTRRQDFGTLRAPFTGIHGWYWENPGSETATIKLTTAGFYESAIEIGSDRSRKTHPVTALADLHKARAEP